MDEAIKIYLLLGLVIILLIIRVPLKRYLGRKAEAAGRRAGVALDEKVANSRFANLAQHRLATILTLGDRGFNVAVDALSNAKGVGRVSPSEWTLKFAKDDDVRFAWVSTDGGTQGYLMVTSAVDMLDGPVGDRQWLKTIETVKKAAQASGVSAHREERAPLVKSDAVTSGQSVWVQAQ